MTTLDVLLAVRGLLAEPERWFKCKLGQSRELARNVEDRQVSVFHPHACKFTLYGAFVRVQHITQSAHVGLAYNLLKETLDPSGSIPVANFNDARGTTHWAVLQLLDRAIRLAGGTPPVVLAEEQNYE